MIKQEQYLDCSTACQSTALMQMLDGKIFQDKFQTDMKISVKKAAPDVYSLSFGDTEVAVDGNELKTLLLEVTKVLMPGTSLGKSAEDKARDFMRHIKNANDVGIQTFLITAEYEDILVLLKCAEDDKMLLNKLYSNMSERSKTMAVEDLNYKYKNGVPSSQMQTAIIRLRAVLKKLEDKGTVVIENLKERHVTQGTTED